MVPFNTPADSIIAATLPSPEFFNSLSQEETCRHIAMRVVAEVTRDGGVSKKHPAARFFDHVVDQAGRYLVIVVEPDAGVFVVDPGNT